MKQFIVPYKNDVIQYKWPMIGQYNYTFYHWSIIMYTGLSLVITLDLGSTQSTSACHPEGDRFKSRSDNASQLKTLKYGSYCCYVRCATKIVRAGEMPLSKTGTKGRAVKGIFVWWVLVSLGNCACYTAIQNAD